MKFLKKINIILIFLLILFLNIVKVSGLFVFAENAYLKKIIDYRIIEDKGDNIDAYNLGKNITRIEALKIALNLRGNSLIDKCDGIFKDVNKGFWGCKYVETALEYGLITKNTYFKPNNNITELEILKIIMNSTDINKEKGASDWKSAYIKGAYNELLIDDIKDVSEKRNAKRDFVFNIVGKVIKLKEKEYDENRKNIIYKKTFTSTLYRFSNNKIFFNNKEIKNIDLKTFENLNNFYSKDKNKIYFCTIELGCKILYSKNTKAFSVIENSLFAMDNKNIFFDGKKIPNIDVNTFSKIDGEYIKDNNNVFICKEKSGCTQIIGANGESFKLLDNYYSTDDNFIYYCSKTNFCFKTDLDKKTFIYIGDGYVKDKNFYYYNGRAIENLDFGKTYKGYFFNTPDVKQDFFEVLNKYYTKYNKKIYYSEKELKNADYDTFSVLGESQYSKDKNHIYFTNKIIIGVDLDSFKMINDNFSKDKNYIYYNGEKIEGMDINSFKIINNTYSKDKNHIYYTNKILDGFDYKTFTSFDYSPYKKDKDKVYYHGLYLRYADPNNFEALGQKGYAKDESNVYLNGSMIEWVKPENFSVFGNSSYSKDDKYLYYGDYENDITVIGYVNNNNNNGIDLATLKILGTFGYAKDKDNVYFKGKILKDVDVESFEIIDNDNFYAKDNANIYFGDYTSGPIILSGINPTNFKILGNSGYAKDDKNVYYEGEIIEEAHPLNFVVLGDSLYGIDDKNIFYTNKKITWISKNFIKSYK